MKTNGCLPECEEYKGGSEIKHHKDCPNYVGSLSEELDEIKEKLDKLESRVVTNSIAPGGIYEM